jgi:hypothetical protein
MKCARIAAAVERYEALLPAYSWPNWVLGPQGHETFLSADRGIEA